MQPETMPQVGAPPSELPLDDTPLEVAPLDDDPPDETAVDVPEEEPAPEELEAPVPDDAPAHAEPQLPWAHWTNPLQFRLVQLEAAMHVLRAEEQLLLTQLVHVMVSVMPVITETNASGLLHPPERPPDPLLPPEAPPLEPVPATVVFGVALVGAASPFRNALLSPPFLEEHATAALDEAAIQTVHAASLSMPASRNLHIN